jgi:uncharacterized membrane protein
VKKNIWTVLHTIFRVNIFIKGVRGILEILLGLTLLILPLHTIQAFLRWFLELEILFDVINKTVMYVDALTPNVVNGVGIYFIVLGCSKLIIFYGVWNNKLKLYPVAGALLVFFALYQATLLILHFSIIILLWFCFNLITISLLRLEYLKLSKQIKITK